MMAICALLSSCTAEQAAPDGGGDAGDPCLAIASQVSAERYHADLNAISVAREPGSANWQMVQDYCADRLASLGFAVERQAFDGGVNVIGVRKGSSAATNEVLISAHYDSVPNCPSADDNATGVAGVLEAARVLSKTAHQKTLVAACWDREEGDRYTGVAGSKAYAARARERGEMIDVVLVFEMIGYKSTEPGSQQMPVGFDALFPEQDRWLKARQNTGDFIALVNDDRAHAVATDIKYYSKVLGLPTVMMELTQEQKTSGMYMSLMRSDHSPFWKQDYPAMMITDTSEYRNRNYHCPDGTVDSVDRLDSEFAAVVIKATVAAAAKAAGAR
jgi:Zn-dependent M28 family amino/carboxypeptidase